MLEIIILLNRNIAFADASQQWQLMFQDPATPIIEGIVRFHNDRIIVLIGVSAFVSWMLVRCVVHFDEHKNKVPSTVVHGTVIEVVWTIIPALILVVIAIPSFALLYSVDERVDPTRTIKVVGHQWYWTYEYSDTNSSEENSLEFESYMLPDDELSNGSRRLLEVDNRLALPVDTHIRLIITAADVLHSWTIPSFGVKVDACPGRLNQVSLFVTRPGVYYGQCSEICGVNHGFIPIAVEALQIADYSIWLNNMYESA